MYYKKYSLISYLLLTVTLGSAQAMSETNPEVIRVAPKSVIGGYFPGWRVPIVSTESGEWINVEYACSSEPSSEWPFSKLKCSDRASLSIPSSGTLFVRIRGEILQVPKDGGDSLYDALHNNPELLLQYQTRDDLGVNKTVTPWFQLLDFKETVALHVDAAERIEKESIDNQLTYMVLLFLSGIVAFLFSIYVLIRLLKLIRNAVQRVIRRIIYRASVISTEVFAKMSIYRDVARAKKLARIAEEEEVRLRVKMKLEREKE